MEPAFVVWIHQVENEEEVFWKLKIDKGIVPFDLTLVFYKSDMKN
jgi:hypothetical protein